MITVEHLTKTYKGAKKPVIKDLNLELREGEVFGFLGGNGAGKSTTIKCMVGILPFEQGKIEIYGQNIALNPIKAKALIGFVPDNHAVFEMLTGREYVNHMANIYKVSLAQREEITERLLKTFKMAHAFDRTIKTYSHGMKQKIAIMGTLVHSPKFWLLDEPLTGLDPQSGYELKECMKDYAKAGNTVFFSSHIIDVVEKICNRVAILQDGAIQGVYVVKELLDNGISLENLYMEILGRAEQCKI